MPYLRSGDIQTHYHRFGVGQPLIFIHGGLVDKQMWLPQLATLAQQYDMLAYDLRGHGQTVSLSHRSYSLGLLVADLRTLVMRLRVERPILCGLSLGGAVALSYAACFPEDVAALVLCSTAASTAHTVGDRLLAATVGASLPLSVRVMGVPRFADYALEMAERLHGVRWLGRSPAIRAYLRACMVAIAPEELARIYRLILALRPPNLATITAPTLLLNGEYEARSVHQQAVYLHRQLAAAERALITDAGHLLNLDQPERFNTVVRHFLSP